MLAKRYSEFVGSAHLLGLLTQETGEWAAKVYDLSILEMLLETCRYSAMQTKDFTTVDRLKAALTDAGVEVRMSKDGVELVARPRLRPRQAGGAEMRAAHFAGSGGLSAPHGFCEASPRGYLGQR